MAQVPNPKTSDASISLTRPFRDTASGGFDKTYILTPRGRVIEPTLTVRSGSGAHGANTWFLAPGRYVVISVHRPNLKNGWRPYSVTIQCIDFANSGEGHVIAEASLYTNEVHQDDLVEWARGACP
jgi:hypothetical protein